MASSLSSQKAFTLVEMLVAISVATLMALIVIGLLSGTTQATGQSQQHVDADNEAREVFDRMAEDFVGMVKSPNVDYVFAKSGGSGIRNDNLFFYSEAPALADTSSPYPNTCSLVGYRINSQGQLERLGKGLVLGQPPPAGMTFLTYPQPLTSGVSPVPDANSTFANPLWSPILGSPSTMPPYQGAADGDSSSGTYFHVLSEAIFRLEYCFLLKPARLSDGSVLPAVYSDNPYDERLGHGPSLYGIGSSDIQAIVVAIAVLDVKSRKIISQDDLKALGDDLPDSGLSAASTTPTLMAQLWNDALLKDTFPGALKTAVKNVHTYQRAFYLESLLN